MPQPPERPTADPRAGDRIAKLLARAGVASRRDVERMIADRRVALDGVPLETPATILTSLAGITVDGKPVAAPTAARLFLFHKPPGLLVTERDPAGRPTIYDRLPRDLPRVMPVGRLDLATEGLLLLTTDGGLKRQLELPATGVERAYRARAYGHVTQPDLEALIEGVEIEGVRYGSINANLERRTGANVWIEMTLTEGKNREVRRVLEHLGLQVSRLIRTRYGPFVLGDLPVGEVGEVQDADVAAFRKNPRALPPARQTESRRERPTDFERRPRPAAPAPAAARQAVEPDGRRRRAPLARPQQHPRKPQSDRPAPEDKRADKAKFTSKRTLRSAAFKAAHPPRAETDTPAREGRPPRGAVSRDGGARPPRSDGRPARVRTDAAPRAGGGTPRSPRPKGGRPGARPPRPGKR